MNDDDAIKDVYGPELAEDEGAEVEEGDEVLPKKDSEFGDDEDDEEEETTE